MALRWTRALQSAWSPLCTKPASARLVLGIETSFDDTAAAVVAGDGRILSNESESQDAVHASFGGVQPKLAAQAHSSMLGLTLRKYAGRFADSCCRTDGAYLL